MNLMEIALSGYPNDFMQKLVELYRYEEECDTSITCSNGVIKGHSLVLRIALPFWRILEQRQCERMVSVRFTKECMQNVLDLIYTGKTKISSEVRQEVIEAVRYFQLPGVNLDSIETESQENIKHESVVTSSQTSVEVPKTSRLRKNPFAGTKVQSGKILNKKCDTNGQSNDLKSVDLTNFDSSGSATPEDLLVPVSNKVVYQTTQENSDSESSIILIDNPIPCYKVNDSSLETSHIRQPNNCREEVPSTSRVVCATSNNDSPLPHSSEKSPATEDTTPKKRSNPFENFPTSDEEESNIPTKNKRTKRPLRRAVKNVTGSYNDESSDSEGSTINDDFIARASFKEMYKLCVKCHKNFDDIKKHLRIHKPVIRKKINCEKCGKNFSNKPYLLHHKCEKKKD